MDDNAMGQQPAWGPTVHEARARRSRRLQLWRASALLMAWILLGLITVFGQVVDPPSPSPAPGEPAHEQDTKGWVKPGG